MFNLGLIYSILRKYENTREWLKKLAELGDKEAEKELLEIDEKIKK